MGLNVCAFKACILKVGISDHELEKSLEDTGLGPAAKSSKLSVPVPKSGWQIAPG